jgi:hypothetical protein
VPAVGREPADDVLGERPRRRAVELDPVVVVERDELAEPECPASEHASEAMPSWRSPSEQMTYVRWSMRSWPARLNSRASRRSAIAIPIAFASPWPSGPVVASTPGVSAVLRMARA